MRRSVLCAVFTKQEITSLGVTYICLSLYILTRTTELNNWIWCCVNLAPDADWTASCPSRFVPWERVHGTPFVRGGGGCRGGLYTVVKRKIFACAGNRILVIQPVARWLHRLRYPRSLRVCYIPKLRTTSRIQFWSPSTLLYAYRP